MATIGQLTVVLGADARDFTTAISGVKASVRGFQQDLNTSTSGPLAKFAKALKLSESREGAQALRAVKSEVGALASEALGTAGTVGRLGESFLALGVGGPWT